MPTTIDCDGCHGRKAAAITAAEAAIAAAEERIRDAERRIGICEDTTEILDSLTRRLQAAFEHDGSANGRHGRITSSRAVRTLAT